MSSADNNMSARTTKKQNHSDGLDTEFTEEMVDIYEKEAEIRSKNADKIVRGIISTPTLRNG